ncbi:MAG TPA: putative sugar O-methyltransferase [Anaerolineales bacterium]|nr:putative sugar O-methyltransferase [Anaerolineales bacterium]
MEELDRMKIRDIKSKVTAMLEERQALESKDESVVAPSTFWSSICSYFDYMLDLPEEYFAKLRLHTHHLTGDNYQFYFFGDPKRFLVVYNVDGLTKDIPPALVINEPEGGIGFRYNDGRFLSRDIARYQKVITSFYRSGILSEQLNTSAQRRYVLEIGGGYGGLAHHVSNICGNITYIIVDLPETLLFSAAYLSLLNPQKKIHIYEPGDFQEASQFEAMGSCDFVLVPNYKLQALRRLRFDLAINMASFQEMRTSQVEEALDFIRETCTGVFYSLNRDRSSRNSELTDLSDLLKQRFSLLEVGGVDPNKAKGKIGARKKWKLRLVEILKKMAILVGLLDRPAKKDPAPFEVPLPYREYICRPLPLRQDCE